MCQLSNCYEGSNSLYGMTQTHGPDSKVVIWCHRCQKAGRVLLRMSICFWGNLSWNSHHIFLLQNFVMNMSFKAAGQVMFAHLSNTVCFKNSLPSVFAGQRGNGQHSAQCSSVLKILSLSDYSSAEGSNRRPVFQGYTTVVPSLLMTPY